jgi:hypothetical protein
MRWGICRGCQKETLIQNKTKYLCAKCVYSLNHEGRTRQEVSFEKQRNKSNKKVYQYKPKATGERVLFLEIWSEREHICKNCKTLLGSVPCNWMFSHKIAKGVDKSLRLDKGNIDLLCYDCHFAHEFQGKDAYQRRHRE